MQRRHERLLHFAVVGVLLVPLVGAAAGGLLDRLGANPVEQLTHVTGEWALRCLLLTLAVTPAKRLLGWPGLLRYRRSFGLLAYTYAVAHFSVYLVFDLGFDLGFLLEDVAERPYITVGFAAFLGMTPLAVTSTRSWQRRLGRRWQSLHRLSYVVGVLAIVHFWWLVKADELGPAVHAAALGLLLLARRLPARSGR